MAKFKNTPGGKRVSGRTLYNLQLRMRTLANQIRKRRVRLTPEMVENLGLDQDLRTLENATRGKGSYAGGGLWEGERPQHRKHGWQVRSFAPEQPNPPIEGSQMQGTQPKSAGVGGIKGYGGGDVTGIHQVRQEGKGGMIEVNKKIRIEQQKLEMLERDLRSATPKQIDHIEGQIDTHKRKLENLKTKKSYLIRPAKSVRGKTSKIVEISDRVTRRDKAKGIKFSFKDDLKVVAGELERVSPVMPTGTARELLEPGQQNLRAHQRVVTGNPQASFPGAGVVDQADDFLEGFQSAESTNAAGRARASINRVLDPNAQAMVDSPGSRPGLPIGRRTKSGELAKPILDAQGNPEVTVRQTEHYAPDRQLQRSSSWAEIEEPHRQTQQPKRVVGSANFQSRGGSLRRGIVKSGARSQLRREGQGRSSRYAMSGQDVPQVLDESWTTMPRESKITRKPAGPPIPPGGTMQSITPNQQSKITQYIKSLKKSGISTKALIPLLISLGLFGIMGNSEGASNAA
jgi:hypothetical protein